MVFLLCLKTRGMYRFGEYNLGPEKMFSGMESDFIQFLVDSRGKY